MNKFDKEKICQNIMKACDELIKKDKDLFEVDINERTLCHRLAIYMENLFPGYNIDCEYNRIEDDPKKITLKKIEKCLKNKMKEFKMYEKTITVFPDIVIHKRRTQDNLVVIEVKKDTNNQDYSYDFFKLDQYKERLGYKYTFFILFKMKDCQYCVIDCAEQILS